MMSAIVNPMVPRAPEVESSESVSDMDVASEAGGDFANILAPQRRLADEAQREGDATAPGADHSRRSETPVKGETSVKGEKAVKGESPTRGESPSPGELQLQRTTAINPSGATPAIKDFSTLTQGLRREPLRTGQNPVVKEGLAARKFSLDSRSTLETTLSITHSGSNSNPSSNSNAHSNMNGMQALAGAVATLASSTGSGLGLTAGLPSAAPTGAAQGASLTQPSGYLSSPFFVAQPVGAEGWSQQLGDKILTVMRADMGEAVINLAPEELGPVKVSLTVSDGEVRLHWVAHASETRQALEQALPRLREMFAQEGLQLADSQVASGGQQESAGNFASSPEAERGSEASGHATGESRRDPTRVVTVSRHPGLLDLYA